MALFNKSGNNLSRASAILKSLAPKEDTETEVKTEAVEETQEPVTEQETKVEDIKTDVVDTQEPATEAQEQKIEGEETTTDNATPVEVESTSIEPVPKASVELSEELLLEKLSEKLGTQFNSFEDLKPKEVEIDPELKQLQEWKEKTGLPLSEWSNYNKDFSKMKDIDVAREILAREYPNFTKEELDFSLKNYIYDESLDDETDKLKKSIELKKFATKGRETLEASKLELVADSPKAILTNEQQEAIKIAEQFKANQVTIQEQQKNYNEAIGKASQSLNEIDLKLSDDLTIKYNVPVEVKKNLPKMVAEMPHWYNEDGSYNHSNVVKDIAKITNFEAMINSAYKQGISVGKEGMIQKDNNITIDGTPPASTTESKGNVMDVVSKISSSRTGSKLRFRGKNV